MPTVSLPRYDHRRSYEWNYEHPPQPVEIETVPVPGNWDFCGLPVDSPLGIAAGPLLNGAWCLYYASLGFDVLTYKTVRSKGRKCYPMPNLQPVACGPLQGDEECVDAIDALTDSWAVSFGMPSQPPEVWRKDVERTRSELPPGKLLSVSVVASEEPGWGLNELAEDYARCARWAAESGADIVEANFSCPNVSTSDGQLYQVPQNAMRVANRLREAVPDKPLVIKVGRVATDEQIDRLLDAVGGIADALAMTNSIASRVRAEGGTLLFDGQPRGICGGAIHRESLRQVERFSRRVRARRGSVKLAAVGGIDSGAAAGRYLAAGAHACHLATAAMLRPEVGDSIRRTLCETTL